MEELSRALRRQWWLIPLYIITRPMQWFTDLSLKNKATVVILVVSLLAFMVFSINVDNTWTSYNNKKAGNRVEITN